MHAIDIIEKHWPYDGPHTVGSVITAADALVSLTRYLNNATRSPGALESAITTDCVLRSVRIAVGRLDQFARQVAASLRAQAQCGSLFDDRGYPAGADTAEHAAELLSTARAAVNDLVIALDQALAQTTHLGNYVPGEGGDAR